MPVVFIGLWLMLLQHSYRKSVKNEWNQIAAPWVGPMPDDADANKINGTPYTSFSIILSGENRFYKSSPWFQSLPTSCGIMSSVSGRESGKFTEPKHPSQKKTREKADITTVLILYLSASLMVNVFTTMKTVVLLQQIKTRPFSPHQTILNTLEPPTTSISSLS